MHIAAKTRTIERSEYRISKFETNSNLKDHMFKTRQPDTFYMLDVLNVTDSEMVQASLRDSNSSFLLTYPDQPDCIYVIMPMRLLFISC